MSRWRVLSLILALALIATACGGGDESSGDGGGGIDVSGSSTVEPISAANAEKYAAQNPDIAIKVEGPGTGDGAQMFCTGLIDVGDASRPYKGSELELCAENGIEFIELVIAIDGLSVLTSPDNPTTCLATSDLYALLGDESIGFDTWSDANALAAEIGAPNAPYPDEELVITAPGEESGTFDTFVEFLIDGKAGGEDYAETRGVESVRPDYVASANDNVIIEGIVGAPYSLGWVGYAFYTANQDRVKALAIDTGDGCVSPTPETITSGEYPFARELYIYVNTASAQRPEVAAYIDLYLSEEGLTSIDETGYIRLADYGPTRTAWANR
ncbi:substrate-binding domain-containing protein [bacterium]|nr:substrate-binding domain-containing protein [bacterium]